MNQLFNIEPIPPLAWLGIAGVGLFTYLIVGLEKRIRFRPHRAETPATPTRA